MGLMTCRGSTTRLPRALKQWALVACNARSCHPGCLVQAINPRCHVIKNAATGPRVTVVNRGSRYWPGRPGNRWVYRGRPGRNPKPVRIRPSAHLLTAAAAYRGWHRMVRMRTREDSVMPEAEGPAAAFCNNGRLWCWMNRRAIESAHQHGPRRRAAKRPPTYAVAAALNTPSRSQYNACRYPAARRCFDNNAFGQKGIGR